MHNVRLFVCVQDKDGNTVFHTLTQLSADYPQKAKTYLTVFQALLDQVSRSTGLIGCLVSS